MSSFAQNVCKKITRKKATYKAEMAELMRKEKEATEKEEEAAWLAAEKAAKKEVKKGKKCAVEESGADVGAKGSKPKKKSKDSCSGQGRQESPRDHQGLL